MAKKESASAQATPRTDVESDEAPAEILKKITSATVLGEKVAKLAPEEGEKPVFLYRVYGIASGTKHGSTNLGEWTGLTGMFEAVRLSDGRRFASGVCILPGAVGDMLVGGLKAARDRDPDATVQFAIEIGVKYMERKDGTDGYEYTSREIAKVKQADLLSELRVLALPKPE